MKKIIGVIGFFALCGIQNEILGLAVLSLLSIAGFIFLYVEAERHGE